MRYLVTGTGRCGTLFAAEFLQAKGLDVRHEKMGRDGTSNWWLTCAWELCPAPVFARVLHIIREPLATISSLTTCKENHEIWDHIVPNTPVSRDDPLILRCMKHWHYWNLMGEGMADRSMRIETWSMESVAEFFGLSGPDPGIPTDTHTWKGSFRPYAWEDLADIDHELTRLIRQQARRYGYSYPHEAHLDNRQHV